MNDILESFDSNQQSKPNTWIKVSKVISIINIVFIFLLGLPFMLFSIETVVTSTQLENGNSIIAALGLIFVLIIYSYISFIQQKAWAKIPVIILSCIQLIAIPVGTILGGLMLVAIYKNKHVPQKP